MSENSRISSQTLRKQPIMAPKNLNPILDPRRASYDAGWKKVGPKVPKMNIYGTSSPKSYHSTEQKIKDVYFGPVNTHTPPKADFSSSFAFITKPLTQHLDVSYIASQVGPAYDSSASFRNVNTNNQTYYSPEPINFSSTTPSGYSTTNYINTLPQKIPKPFASFKPYTSVEEPPNPMGMKPQLSPVMQNITFQPFTQPPDNNRAVSQLSQEFHPTQDATFQTSPNLKFPRLMIEYNISPSLKKSFTKLGPVLGKIGSKNSCQSLVHILSQVHLYVSLDELYSLLYNTQPFVEAVKTAEVPTSSKFETVQLLHLILVTFQHPQLTTGLLSCDPIQKLKVSASKYQDILRTFLAIKIILTAVKKVDYPSSNRFAVSRADIYKVYYIFCQKLLRKYPEFSECVGSSKTLILSVVRIGKLIKLIYPNLHSKRLGQRGHSKAHFMGLAWNYSFVDSETRHLLNFDLQELNDYFPSEKVKGTKVTPNLQTGTWSSQGNIDRNFVIPSFSLDVSPSQVPHPNYTFSLTNPMDLVSPKSGKQTSKPSRDQSMGPSIIWKEPWKNGTP
ncbi:hypothetical protein JCM33374_g3570 [Metschnikowia sp. JCM 33374]|nr:hypothetical protein JCM33374_g3570 [Metschnikowia sp. JCM 33374]